MAEAKKKFNPEYEPPEEDVDEWKSIVSKNIRDMREKAGLSQEAAARQLGVSWQTVSRWENNKRFPSPKDLHALSILYKCKPSDFYKGVEGM